MKLSIAWIFDHIDANWKKLNIDQLVDQFNKKTAEIEGVEHVKINLDELSLARVVSVKADSVNAFCPEWREEFALAVRDNAKENDLYLIKKTPDGVMWATVRDFHCNKDGLMPAMYVEEKLIEGGWKKNFEAEDYLLEVDNKSITNRPDMWGHRGFAREIAAIFDLPFLEEQKILADIPIKEVGNATGPIAGNPFSIEIKAPKICKRFAGLYVSTIEHRPSLLWMAGRLARVGTRPIDAIVDTTNYVMLDIVEPMHAFDAATLPTKKIVPRLAKAGETLTLLDGQVLELTPQDLVITDGKKPIALGGLMGGATSGISSTTKSLFLEAANFDATTIRRTAARFKARTEASARFEKSLDPNINVSALQRFVKLITDEKIPLEHAQAIVSLGKPAQEKVISVTHKFIERHLGVELTEEFVTRVLQKLCFGVTIQKDTDTIIYSVTVPTFRATKDVTIKEDIVEEVGRFYGYTAIESVLPKIQMRPSSLRPLYQLRKIKQLMAYHLNMREVQNYAFYDEELLSSLQWHVDNPIQVKNPVSDMRKVLVSWLVPHLLQNIEQNYTKHDRLQFFECNSVWQRDAKNPDTIIEYKSLAGVLFNKKGTVDFYESKRLLDTVFRMLALEVAWVKEEKILSPWYREYQTAALMYQGQKIGVAGKASPAFINRLIEGDAFIFELNADVLKKAKPIAKRFDPLPKYQDVSLDISMLVPLELTVSGLERVIFEADSKIFYVELIDFFEKGEWKDKRSLTFKFSLRDLEKTMTKDDIDHVWKKVVAVTEKHGVTIR